MQPRERSTPSSTNPAPPPTRQGDDPLADYHRVADTIGGLPNLRLKDNLYQAAFIFAVTGAAAFVGFFISGMGGLIIGSLAGLVGSAFISGVVLMVLGFIRAARK